MKTNSRIQASRYFGICLVAILIVSTPGWHGAAPVVELSLSLAGWTAVAIGTLGRVWAGSYICGFKNCRLATQGPYSVCRNPLYFFSFIAGFGVMAITETFTFPVVFSILFWICYSRVMRREERDLRGHHGYPFEEYMTRVPRFWPDFRLYAEPPTYAVSSRHFRKHIGDAAWFVIAGGLLEFLERLHYAGYLPNLIRIF